MAPPVAGRTPRTMIRRPPGPEPVRTTACSSMPSRDQPVEFAVTCWMFQRVSEVISDDEIVAVEFGTGGCVDADLPPVQTVEFLDRELPGEPGRPPIGAWVDRRATPGCRSVRSHRRSTSATGRVRPPCPTTLNGDVGTNPSASAAAFAAWIALIRGAAGAPRVRDEAVVGSQYRTLGGDRNIADRTEDVDAVVPLLHVDIGQAVVVGSEPNP